jgi:hypothetical protein
MGSKIEGGGTDAPPNLCLHIGLRGTTARDGSAVTRRKPQWIKGLSGAAFALLRLNTPGARNELRG